MNRHPHFVFTTSDLEVRGHRCARLFEVVVTEDDVESDQEYLHLHEARQERIKI